ALESALENGSPLLQLLGVISDVRPAQRVGDVAESRNDLSGGRPIEGGNVALLRRHLLRLHREEVLDEEFGCRTARTSRRSRQDQLLNDVGVLHWEHVVDGESPLFLPSLES